MHIFDTFTFTFPLSLVFPLFPFTYYCFLFLLSIFYFPDMKTVDIPEEGLYFFVLCSHLCELVIYPDLILPLTNRVFAVSSGNCFVIVGKKIYFEGSIWIRYYEIEVRESRNTNSHGPGTCLEMTINDKCSGSRLAKHPYFQCDPNNCGRKPRLNLNH
jgi:hypothetical protein